MKTIPKRRYFWLLALLSLTLPYVSASELVIINNPQPNYSGLAVDGLNQSLRNNGLDGVVELHNDGLPIYKEGGIEKEVLPHVLVKIILERKCGIDDKDAPIDIMLLKRYTYNEYLQTRFAYWMNRTKNPLSALGFDCGIQISDRNGRMVFWQSQQNLTMMGYEIVRCTTARRPHLFEARRKALAAQEWRRRLMENIIGLFHGFRTHAVAKGMALMTGMAILGATALVGAIYGVWKFIQKVMDKLFNAPRLKLVDAHQTNIYGKYFWERWWGKLFGYTVAEAFPKGHYPAEMQPTIARLKELAIAWRDGKQKEVPNVLAIGAPGVGKTLLFKTIAKECGLKYIAPTAADLAQLDEAEALQEVKALLKFACQQHAMLIFDEIDQLFADGAKYKLIQGLFQAEFASGLGQATWLIGITNYPEQLSPAMQD